jgi:hypothetical protein
MFAQLSVAKTGFKVPIFLLHATEGEEMTFDDFRILYTSMYAEPRFALIVDLISIGNIPWSEITKLVEMLQELKPRTKEQLLGSAIIATSSIVRWSIQLLTQQYPMCAPNSVVENIDQASAFIQTL